VTGHRGFVSPGRLLRQGCYWQSCRNNRLTTAQLSRDHAGFADRRYQAIVGIEAAALIGGLAVINTVLSRPVLAGPWIALVVGVHFFGLARLWHVTSFQMLGVAMVILGAAGFLLSALSVSPGMIDFVSGVGSGAALFITVGAAVVKAN